MCPVWKGVLVSVSGKNNTCFIGLYCPAYTCMHTPPHAHHTPTPSNMHTLPPKLTPTLPHPLTLPHPPTFPHPPGFVPEAPPGSMEARTAQLRNCISVLFMFERKPVRDKPFSEDCRQWLDLLVSDVVPGMEGGGANNMIMSKEIRPGKGEGSLWG